MSVFVDFDSSHAFLSVLALLSYRLLFHSDRNLNFFSLVLCVCCAYSGTQIMVVLFKLTPVALDAGVHAETHGVMYTVVSLMRTLSTEVLAWLHGVSVWAVKHVCASAVTDVELRARCSQSLDWLQSLATSDASG